MDESFLNAVKANAEKAGVFGEVKIANGRLQCAAAASAEPAWYRVERVGSAGWHVALVTADRWLSESIEADLMHHGDPLEELIEEELVEQGFTNASPKLAKPSTLATPVIVKHFRSDDMLYTFQSPLPIENSTSTAKADAAVTVATQWLLAYEAAFRELGDMNEA